MEPKGSSFATMGTGYSLQRDFLITGATGGLGAAFVRRLAPVATALLLTGRNEQRLAALKEEAEVLGASRVITLNLDLAQPGAGAELARQTGAILGPKSGAILNAGFSLNEAAWAGQAEAQRQELALNAGSVLHFLRARAPALQSEGGGLVLMVASIAGMAGIPQQSGYAAAKAFSLSLGQALHHELKDLGVGCTTYRAGLIETEFFERAGLDRNRRWGRLAQFAQPDQAAERALRGLERGHMLVTHGWQNRVMILLHRILSRRQISCLNAWAVES